MPTTTQTLCYNCFQQVADPTAPCPHCGFDLAENRQKFPVALRAGTVLNNRYIVGRVLGQGGFGITYVAFDTQLQARVAIKEYMPNEIATRIEGTTVSVAMDTRADDFTYGAERFQEEARTLAKFIGHPNIAGVSSYFDENDTSYFVMDYIEGVSFKSYIANNGGKVSVDETLNVMIPVLRALTAVHAEGFIHRDVTPDNIYISKDGNVKLLDFGSARYSIGDKSKSLDVILKVGYAPKEQYTRRGRQGPYTDVYSCAACFYAALTGYLPPESLDRLEHDTLTPVSQVMDIPEWLDKAILKGLAVQPEDRFQSAAEFLDAIENQLVVDVPAAAPPAPQKKPKTALIAGVAAALVVVVGVGAFLAGRGGGGTASPSSSAPGTGGGNSGGGGGILGALTGQDDGLPPLIKSEVATVTIDGKKYSTDERYLNLNEVTLKQEDLDQIQYMVNLVGLYLELSDSYTAPDFSFVSHIPNLQTVYINGQFPEYEPLDLTPFQNLTQLKELQINPYSGGNSIQGVDDLTFLTGLNNLQKLKLTLGDVEDMSPLTGLTNLVELNLSGNFKTSDLSFLDGMTELESLELWMEGIQSLSGLEKLSGLKKLSLNFSTPEIDSIDEFAGLTELRFLTVQMSFRDGEVTPYPKEVPLSLEPLGKLVKLQELNFFVSGYILDTNLTPFGNLIDLRKLYLTNSGSDSYIFTDISPLEKLTKLEELSISPANVTDWSPVDHVGYVIGRG